MSEEDDTGEDAWQRLGEVVPAVLRRIAERVAVHEPEVAE